MSSLFEDEEPGYNSNSRTQQNLSSLFSGDGGGAGGNKSLSYQAPKQPKQATKEAPVDTGTPALLLVAPIVLNRYDPATYAF